MDIQEGDRDRPHPWPNLVTSLAREQKHEKCEGGAVFVDFIYMSTPAPQITSA